jgi:hypothetical protein
MSYSNCVLDDQKPNGATSDSKDIKPKKADKNESTEDKGKSRF